MGTKPVVIVVVRDGVAEVERGSAYVVDMDAFNIASVDEKGEMVYNLLSFMEDNEMLDDNEARDLTHQKLDKLMDSLLAIASQEGN